MEHLIHEAFRARDNWDFWGSMEKPPVWETCFKQ